MHNPGYKKVKKPLPRQNSEADIALSHIVACEFGIKHKHDKIIVLEDDFILKPPYSKRVLQKKLKSLFPKIHV